MHPCLIKYLQMYRWIVEAYLELGFIANLEKLENLENLVNLAIEPFCGKGQGKSGKVKEFS